MILRGQLGALGQVHERVEVAQEAWMRVQRAQAAGNGVGGATEAALEHGPVDEDARGRTLGLGLPRLALLLRHEEANQLHDLVVRPPLALRLLILLVGIDGGGSCQR